MRYVFDSGPLIDLFKHYYPTRFPSLWDNFYGLVSEGQLTSVREVYNEIESGGDSLADWAKQQKNKLFLPPTKNDFLFVSEIFKVQHFQAMIRKKERLRGKPVADPFVIARAKILEAQVITNEHYKKNAAQIPNVCEYFSIQYTNLEGFMRQENWTF